MKSRMLYGCEIWPAKMKDVKKVEWMELQKARWMSDTSLSNKVDGVTLLVKSGIMCNEYVIYTDS